MKFSSSKTTSRIMVVGDLMVDHYIWGKCNRISPEAPVPVVEIDRESHTLGGAGNVVQNLKELGAEVEVVSVLGSDASGDQVKQILMDLKISTSGLLKVDTRKTSRKSRIIVGRQQIIRFDDESKEDIASETEGELFKKFEILLDSCDTIILSDYNKGLLTFNFTQRLIQRARKQGKRVLVDPKGKSYQKYKGAYLIKPNKQEAGEATGIEIADDDTLQNVLEKLKEDVGIENVLVTLSDKGMALYDDEISLHPTRAREVFDVTGAGDTVIASLAFALANNTDLREAVHFANLAAGVVVGKVGSATATLDEIVEYEQSFISNSNEYKICDFKDFKERCEFLARGQRSLKGVLGNWEEVSVPLIIRLKGIQSNNQPFVIGLYDIPSRIKKNVATAFAALEFVGTVVFVRAEEKETFVRIVGAHGTFIEDGNR